MRRYVFAVKKLVLEFLPLSITQIQRFLIGMKEIEFLNEGRRQEAVFVKGIYAP
jgi:hypothetical protein